MEKIATPIADLYILEPKVFRDERGYFTELFNQKKFQELGFTYQFIQDNQSSSTYGVIRGLHYQLAPFAQTKLVRAVRGRIFDVAVDLRKGSPTFGKWYGVELSEDNFRQLLIPRGFAHGFSVLSETAIVHYKCDNLYHPQSERGINYNDPILAIDWQVPHDRAIVSPKDRMWPNFDKAEMNFY
ncbi:MAG: dTDP-4-dehydrorhamnose 3,5-epimerase [Bacteroidales bacterium]